MVADSGEAAVDDVEQGGGEPVVGSWGVLEAQLNLSFNAGCTPQQNVWCVLAELVPPIAVAHRQGVDDGDRPVGVRNVVSSTMVRSR